MRGYISGTVRAVQHGEGSPQSFTDVEDVERFG